MRMTHAKIPPRAAVDLADRLHSAAIHLLRRVRRTDAESGLNGPRLSALSVIVFGGPLTLGGLAAAEQVKPPTMTRIVQALLQRKLVRKERNEGDARQTVLVATPAGRRLLLEARRKRVAMLAREVAALGAGERLELQRALGVMEKIAMRK